MRDRHFLVVGFDFGTTFSKLVVQDQNRQIASVFHAPSPLGASKGYLIPSIISFHNGHLYPPYGLSDEGQIPYLKMFAKRLLLSGQDKDDREITLPPALSSLLSRSTVQEGVENTMAWYFTHIIAVARQFFVSQRPWADFDFEQKRSRDFWCIQMCVPTDHLKIDRLKDSMLTALKLAFLLHQKVDPKLKRSQSADVWWDECGQAREAIRNGAALHNCRVYPEVAAGIQAVLRSGTANDGLYITMDVGSGTVDMNVFRRHLDLPLSYYATCVTPLGIQRMEERRNYDPFCDGPLEDHRSLTPFLHLLSANRLMNELHDEIDMMVNRALLRQRNHRAGNSSTWDSSIIYVWGGGSLHEGYPAQLGQSLAGKRHVAQPVCRQLPCPPNLKLPLSADFGRLAIAYGLSFQRDNLDDILLPEQIDEMPPQKRDRAYDPENNTGNPPYDY